MKYDNIKSRPLHEDGIAVIQQFAGNSLIPVAISEKTVR